MTRNNHTCTSSQGNHKPQNALLTIGSHRLPMLTRPNTCIDEYVERIVVRIFLEYRERLLNSIT